MLEVIIPARELFDNDIQEFVNYSEQKLCLEHSLISISKWEEKWCVPFLSRQEKTDEEILDYIRCMTITKNVDKKVYEFITKKNILEINQYINSPMTATTFSNNQSRPNREIITSELIYYWMIAYNIPFECQKWHLNRLLTLINICSIKNQPPKKMSKSEIMSRNKSLNSARRSAYHTKG